jgi:hypothetical protein
MMLRSLAFVSAAVLLFLSGIVHGLWTNRWHSSPEVEEFASRLAVIPRTIGDWHATDLELTSREIEVARIDGYCYRRYENSRNHRSVQMLLVCGRAGPIAAHTPDVCFQGAGYRAVNEPTLLSLPYGPADAEAGFRTMRLAQQESAFPIEIRVYWTWSAGGPWQAPSNPRMSFAGRRALYKLYLLREKTEDHIPPESDPCAEFLRLLLPELDSRLCPPTRK